MLNEISYKSSDAEKPRSVQQRRAPFPRYGFVGIVVMAAGEALLFGGAGFIGTWFTPVMWTGYVLLLDALIRRRKSTSLLSDHPLEFLLLVVISIASWMIFEGYNVLLKNWHYVGLPENLVVRYVGYAWAFASISPGMFLTYELLESLLPGRSVTRPRQLSNSVFWPFVLCGLAAMIVPFIWPSTYMTPLVWIGFAFFLDPINGRMGERSFLNEFFTGHFRSMPIMFLAGLICGFLWEFWNYWAASKWHYDVPYWGHVKIFEMPALGFLGFLPFAVESYAIYVFVRRLLPIERRVRYLG